MADEHIDVTEDRDVTEATIDHELDAASQPVEEDIPEEEKIYFFSMDTTTYVADARTLPIDWANIDVAQTFSQLYTNLIFIRQYLRELMYAKIDNLEDVEAVKQAEDHRKQLAENSMGLTVPYLEGNFGIHPHYDETFPNIGIIEKAAFYCIDCIEVITKMMYEVRIRGKHHQENVNTEEEKTNEVH